MANKVTTRKIIRKYIYNEAGSNKNTVIILDMHVQITQNTNKVTTE